MKMNFSSVNGSSTAGSQRDAFTTALTKNLIVTLLCISINYINSTLVHTFRKHQVFYSNPRYMLFIHLVINDMMQLMLTTLLHIISYAFYTINVSFCLILIVLTIIATLNTPLNLAGMAVECFIAICFPLRHGQICTVKKTYILIALIWVVSALCILPDVFILIGTEPRQFFQTRIFCAIFVLFGNSYNVKKKTATYFFFLALVCLILFYTYFRILFAAKKTNSNIEKARKTILLHGFQLLLCTLVYLKPVFEEVLLLIFPNRIMDVRFALYVFIQILPRFVSPIVYGLRDQLFRSYMRKHLFGK